MGNGYSYKCRKCGHEYSIHIGSGMLYPMAYKSFVKDISEGKYGADRQKTLNDTLYAVVNAEETLYICDKCNHWEIRNDLTIYAPNDPDKVENERYGDKTVKELGYVPYVMENDLKENYHAIKRYYCSCPECGKRMHKAGDMEWYRLACPECGELNEVESRILWD